MSLYSKIKKIKQLIAFYLIPTANDYEFQIETTNICNARCEFCPNPTLKRRKQIMDMEVFEKIISRIKDEKIKVKRFILHLNGEPLTDPLIFDRVDLLKKRFGGVFQ